MQRIHEEIRIDKPHQAYVMINCEDGTLESVREELKLIEYVKEVTPTFGAYDIVTKIASPTVESLREIIALRIRRIPEVRTTTTIICMPTTPILYSN